MKVRLIAITALFACITNETFAQDLLGLRTSRYLGAQSAIFNPANIADSRHKVSLNLFSFDLMLNNSLLHFDKNTINDLDNIQNIFNESTDPISAKINAGIIGPGLMIKINPKHSIAINSRVRAVVDVNKIDQDLYRNIAVSAEDLESGVKGISSPYTQYVNATGWGEIGFTYAATLIDYNAHFLKAGITGKYLIPFSNNRIMIDNFDGVIAVDEVNETANLINTTGTISIEQSGVDLQNIKNFKVNDIFKTSNRSVGFDVGFVYEYRPKYYKYKDTTTNKYNSPKEKYAFRLGVSVLDFGKMDFDRNANSGTFDIDIDGAEAYDLRSLEDVEFPGGIIDHLRNRPQYFTERAVANPELYTLKMPTNLNIDLDIKLLSWLYINGAYQKFMSTENEFGQTLASLDNFTITPRIEMKTFGVYLPINNSELTGTNIGAAVRFGGFFIGSSNAITLLTSGSKRVNVYMGMSIGLASKK